MNAVIDRRFRPETGVTTGPRLSAQPPPRPTEAACCVQFTGSWNRDDRGLQMSRLARTSGCLLLLSLAVLGFAAQTSWAARPAAAAHRSSLEGTLGYEGGPYPGGFHPTAGSVQVAFMINPLVLEKTVGKSGHFTIPLAAGTYTVTGCGPISSANPNPRCGRATTIKLRAGERRQLRLVWMDAP